MEIELNSEQLDAVTSTEGHVRVIAGAGTGKTRTLTHRFAFLVNEMGILPENILCVTFTNKAANEMRQRIHNLIGDNDTGYINTFHGFCVSVLQEDSHIIQYPKSFIVLDNSDINDMLQIIYEERNLTLKDMKYKDARDMIEIEKTVNKPDYYLDMVDMSLEALRDKYINATAVKDIIFYGYLYQEKKCFGLDYNDLIKFTLHIFKIADDVRLKWQKRLEYIMIDEFQDIDGLQYELMQVLCGYHHNLFIVGDPDQTIYTWRGANVNYLMDFTKNYPDTKTIKLLNNYRSTPQILAVANSLISKNKNRIDKVLVPTLPDAEKPIFYYANKSDDEANWIVKRIRFLHDNNIDYNKITILYRAHYVTQSIEAALIREKVPYHIYNGTQFYERREIKDALSYLRMVVYQDDLSFRRIVNNPKRNIGKQRMVDIERYADENGCSLYRALKYLSDTDKFKRTKANQFISLIEDFLNDYEKLTVSDFLSAIMDKSGYETMLRTKGDQERLDNLAELKQSVYEYETTCGEELTAEHYLNHIALFTNSDEEDSADKVKLMTIHAAKGLEFPFVILCGMNEGIFPSRRIKDLSGMEEERRLAFVAVTRAEKGLFLSGAEGRNHDGSPRYPSRFIFNIDEELLEYEKIPNEYLIAEAKSHIDLSERFMPENIENSILPIGARVQHKHLGEGSITDIDRKKGAYVIQFDSIPTPRTISFRVSLTEL